MKSIAVAVLACLFVLSLAPAETLKVGPNEDFDKPSEAVAAAKDGDVIEIDAEGDYDGDVCRISQNHLTLRGVNGRARLDSKGKVSHGKGIFYVTGNDITVENIEFIGARAPDRNGAGIRAQGRNLTVRNCRFHDCQDAILNGAGTVIIEHCEFSHCGLSSRPYTHNLYMDTKVDKLIYRFNYSHNVKVGHLLKSRAKENHILYNRLSDEAEGTGSYVIDLPNGGKSFVIGNILHKGPKGANNVVVAYGGEGIKHKDSALYVVNNTMVNDKAGGMFIRAWNVDDDFELIVANNIFAGKAKTVCNLKLAKLHANHTGDAKLGDISKLDVRLLPGSPCIDAGENLDDVGGVSLMPKWRYVHPASGKTRVDAGKIDIGALPFLPEAATQEASCDENSGEPKPARSE